jgi:filamentous hemagglutinin
MAAVEAVAAKGAAGLGKINGNFSAIELGPLTTKYAETFAGGRYTTITLQNDTVLYRAGTAGNPLGEYFSLEPPTSVLQMRIDKAVLPEWPNGAKSPIDTSFAVKIPAGTQVHLGQVGTQNGFYVGGTQQIIVPKPWTIEGIQVINSSPLK